MADISSPRSRGRRPGARRLWLIAAGVVVVVVVVIVAVVASVGHGETYQTFRSRCLAQGGSEVTLSTTVRNVSMGGPETGYTVGCRQPDGKITATIKTNHL